MANEKSIIDILIIGGDVQVLEHARYFQEPSWNFTFLNFKDYRSGKSENTVSPKPVITILVVDDKQEIERQLEKRPPGSLLIVLSENSQIEYATKCLNSGANGFVSLGCQDVFRELKWVITELLSDGTRQRKAFSGVGTNGGNKVSIDAHRWSALIRR